MSGWKFYGSSHVDINRFKNIKIYLPGHLQQPVRFYRNRILLFGHHLLPTPGGKHFFIKVVALYVNKCKVIKYNNYGFCNW